MNSCRCCFKNVFQRLKYHYKCEPLIHKKYFHSSIKHTVYEEKIANPNNFTNNIAQPFSSKGTEVENPLINVENSSIFYILNDKDKSFYNFLYPAISSDLPSQDLLLTELQNSLTVNDVFGALGNYHKPLSINQACQTIFSLSHIKNNRQFKYKNSLIHFRLDANFNSLIYSHPHFITVLKILEENVERLTDKAASLMMCLNDLNVELSHQLMIKLHLSLLNCISNLDKYSLAQLSFVFINKGMKGYFTQIKILSEINKKCKYLTTLEDLLLVSMIYHNMQKVISTENEDLYIDIVHSFIKEKKLDDSNSTDLLLILKTINNLCKSKAPYSISKYIYELLTKEFQNLTPQQLVMLNSLFLYSMESKKLLYKMQDYASQYIDECSSISLKSDLLLCLSTDSSYKKRKLYESIASEIIMESLSGQDFGSLSKAIRNLKSSNYQLCNSLWDKALEKVKERLLHVDNSIGMQERVLEDFFKKFMHSFYQFRYKTSESEMISLLKAELKTGTQYIPTKAAHMIGFLIAFSDEDLHVEWYDILQRNFNQLNEFDIYFISKGVQIQLNNNNVRKRDNMVFLSKLKNLLDCCTENKIKNVTCLEDVVFLTSSYLMREGSAESSLFLALNQEHGKYMNELNSRYIRMMMRNYKSACYINTEVFEAVTDYVIENEESILFTLVHKVLSSFYALGFTPSRASEFADACRRAIESDCERMPCHLLLESCIAISQYKPLTSDLIHYIFSVEFLDQLEEEISYGITGSYADYVRGLLMKLNRIVCLDNPEEKIPWFHEKYCKDELETKRLGKFAFQADVFHILSLILGNKNLICENKTSPYYYNIEFEFAINEEGLPVFPFEQTTLNQGERNLFQKDKEYVKPFKRVAVLPRRKSCYPHNGTALIGPCQVQRKHLEILGYIVVEVPEHEWHSMAIASNVDKFKLLKSLIYKEMLKS